MIEMEDFDFAEMMAKIVIDAEWKKVMQDAAQQVWLIESDGSTRTWSLDC